MEMISAKRLAVYAFVCLLLPFALLAIPRPSPQAVVPQVPTTPVPPRSAGKSLLDGRNPWTLAEARAALQRQPDDGYLQFVVLQLARQENRLAEVLTDCSEFAAWLKAPPVQLLGLFTDSAAVQRRLQYGTMTAGVVTRPGGRQASQDGKSDSRLTGRSGGLPEVAAGTTPRAAFPTDSSWCSVALAGAAAIGLPHANASSEDNRAAPALPNPTLASGLGAAHDRRKPQPGRTPRLSMVSRCIPDDHYLAEFASLERLVRVLDVGKPLYTFLGVQTRHDATDGAFRQRLQEQLAFEPGPDLQTLVDEVGLTGSDPYLGEGSDVTLVLRLKRGAAGPFKDRTDRALAQAGARADVARASGSYLGVSYTFVVTPDRKLSAYAASLIAHDVDLHIRSNSRVALHRVIATVLGRDVAKRSVPSLAESIAFQRVRTLLPLGDNEEDGLLYLSQSMLTRLAAAPAQLTEARRLRGAGHLRMINHAIGLYRSQQSRTPSSLDDLVRAGCAPFPFNEGALVSPFGGTYALASDGMTGICSVLGTTSFLTPLCELKVATFTPEELRSYRAFADAHGPQQLVGRVPLALRVHAGAREVRGEALFPRAVGPAHAGLPSWLGGDPEALDPLPVPARSIASISVRLNNESWIKEHLGVLRPQQLSALGWTNAVLAAAWQNPYPAGLTCGAFVAASRDVDVPRHAGPADLEKLGLERSEIRAFLEHGIGNQAALHFCDAALPFDLSLPSLAADLASAALTGEMRELDGLVARSLLAGALSGPVYVAIPVRDAPTVDKFLGQLDAIMARRVPEWRGELSGTPLRGEFCRLAASGVIQPRVLSVRAGPASFRVLWARIGDGLYITHQLGILEDVQRTVARSTGVNASNRGPVAHAMVRLRPANWSVVLPGFRLGWEEANRAACHRNLDRLAAATRAFVTPLPGVPIDRDSREALVLKYAARLYGCAFACPDGGHYALADDGKSFVCDVHGSPNVPRQPERPRPGSVAADLTDNLADITLTFTNTHEGLRAVLTMTRR